MPDLNAINPADLKCGSCGHVHAGADLGFICIGCPCLHRGGDVRNNFLRPIEPLLVGDSQLFKALDDPEAGS